MKFVLKWCCLKFEIACKIQRNYLLYNFFFFFFFWSAIHFNFWLLGMKAKKNHSKFDENPTRIRKSVTGAWIGARIFYVTAMKINMQSCHEQSSIHVSSPNTAISRFSRGSNETRVAASAQNVIGTSFQL